MQLSPTLGEALARCDELQAKLVVLRQQRGQVAHALAGSGLTLNYQPNVSLNGLAMTRQDILRMIEGANEDMLEDLRQMLSRGGRR